ncbi:OmpH family outer membrane protein [Flavivirga aquimarina]|uniref:OmpH family outer membrane protein n=1 Tax=Flavivirga aquimarina TaxID=2027862 RepID=A0ABT8W7C5_9FLAO|nr:OmpH family outer membrane protein [Flavivirga aquimarina]MDO5969000.1 OmpH family outer membrane protein [Flavivirga aquimarina]
MNRFNIHPTINTIVLVIVLITGIIYGIQENKQEIVYIDNIKLFNGFNMTKDIKVIEEAKIKKAGKVLDSLYVIFKSINDKENTSFKSLQQQIAKKSKAFQELQDNYTHNLSKNVWDRLNNYIKVYAQTNNLKIILGTSGNGNVMFAEETIDITNQILEFSNRKYEGNN